MTEQDHALTPKQAAKYVGISESALRLWRTEGVGPRYYKAGAKLVRYKRADLDRWIEGRMRPLVATESNLRERCA